MALLSIFILLLQSVFLISPPHTSAANFNEVFLRLDNLKENSSLAGILCTKPSSTTTTESKITITFPIDFTINQTLVNWTTGNSNLPEESTSWPSISSTASEINGQSVTFSSGNLLSTSQLHCFRFTGNSSTTGSIGTKTGTVATKNSGNQVIDSSEYAVAILENNKVTISATVPANPTDYQILLNALNNVSLVGQNYVLDYEITYGSSLDYPSNITLEASWNQGTVEGTPSNIDIVGYSFGSASTTDAAIAPVLDLANRKITWTINSFPGQTYDKKVYFSLKTLNYTGSSKINFSTSAKITGPGVTTPNKTVNSTYQYITSSTTNSSSTSTNSNQTTTTSTTTTASNQTTSTSQRRERPIRYSPIRNLLITNVSESDAQLFLELQGKFFSSIKYGTTPQSLNHSVTSLNQTSNQEIALSDLQPDTNYYFKAETKDENGNVTSSETFIFKTPAVSDKPQIEEDSLIVSSNSNIINSPKTTSQAEKSAETVLKETRARNTIILPLETFYELRFKLISKNLIKEVKTFVRPKNVLGIQDIFASQNETTQSNLDTIQLAEIEPGVYVGKLKSPPQTGVYEIIAKITDQEGNIAENKVVDVKVLNHLTILEKDTQKPIDSARILLSLYNENTRTFQTISGETTAIKNPSFSEANGKVLLTLPPGKYQALVTNLGYQKQTVDFTIGAEPEDKFPTVYLEKAPFNPLTYVRYIGRNIHEVILVNTISYIKSLVKSPRVFNTIASIEIAICIVLIIIAATRGIHIRLKSLPRLVSYQLIKLLKNTSPPHQSIFGKVIETATKTPLSQAQVYILDTRKKSNIIDQITTNKNGQFTLSLPKGHYHIMIMKKGFEPSSNIAYPQVGPKEEVIFTLQKNETLKSSITLHIYWLLINAISFTLEFFLVICIFFEILFIASFGLLRTGPYLIISLLNILIWSLYLKKLGERI